MLDFHRSGHNFNPTFKYSIHGVLFTYRSTPVYPPPRSPSTRTGTSPGSLETYLRRTQRPAMTGYSGKDWKEKKVPPFLSVPWKSSLVENADATSLHFSLLLFLLLLLNLLVVHKLSSIRPFGVNNCIHGYFEILIN